MSIAELKRSLREGRSGVGKHNEATSGNTPREGIKQRLEDRDRLLEMERRGLIKLGTGTLPKKFFSMPRPSDPEGEAVQSLLDDRESSRY